MYGLFKNLLSIWKKWIYTIQSQIPHATNIEIAIIKNKLSSY